MTTSTALRSRAALATVARTTRPTVTLAQYGLARPEIEDARLAVDRVAPGHADPIWRELLDDAEALAPGTPTLRDVLDAMRLSPHPLVVLAAVALETRLRTFESLAARGHAVHH